MDIFEKTKALVPMINMRHPNITPGNDVSLAAIYANPAGRCLFECKKFSAECPSLEVIYGAISPDNPGRAEEWWSAAQDGDVDGAGRLITRASNPLRPVVLECALARGLPTPVLQSMIERVWNHDWLWWEFWLRWRFGSSEELIVEIINQANFSKNHLPEYVTIYRGDQLDPLWEDNPAMFLAQRPSWTLRRPLAHWYAGEYAGWYDGHVPIVGRCRIHRDWASAHFINSDEDEIFVDPEYLRPEEIELEDYDASIARRDP